MVDYFRVASVVACLALAAYGIKQIYDAGYDARQREVDVANAQAQDQAFNDYFDEIERGQQLSARLAATQTKLARVQQRSAVLAARVTGTCPDALRVLVSYASTGAETPMPEAASALAGETGAVGATAPAEADAQPIAENIAVNYARGHACVEKLNALIDFHESVQ
jgi:hypothetical protein